MNLDSLFIYFKKVPFSILGMLKNPVSLTSCAAVASIGAFSTFQKAIFLLVGLFIADFVTGIIASYIEYKKAKELTPAGADYLIQSSKLRLSLVKFITYCLAIVGAYGVEWVYVAVEFEVHENVNKMTVSTIVVAFCSAIEFYSIFFENLKRSGFDIVAKGKKLISAITSLIKTVKNAKNEIS